MKTDTIQEIEKNLKLFLLKYSNEFSTSSLYILAEEYIKQNYFYKNKIYSYNISHNTSYVKIDIQELSYKKTLPCIENYNSIIINLTQIERRKKLKKLYESSL